MGGQQGGMMGKAENVSSCSLVPCTGPRQTARYEMSAGPFWSALACSS